MEGHPLDPWPVVAGHLGRAATAWSIGVYGAIAEYHHCEASPSSRIDEWTVRSALGAIRVTPREGATLLAYEELSADRECWAHGLCVLVPGGTEVAPATRITELGRDASAIDEAYREAVLFDLGIGSPLFRFCVRLSEDAQIAELRRHVGRSVLDAEVIATIKALDPHRLAISALGRIEVYQPIAVSETPLGPHTHFIPRILRPDTATSANVPVVPGYRAGLHLHPASPIRDARGARKPFSSAEHVEFQRLLDDYGDRAYLAAKRRAEAVLRGGAVGEPAEEASRIERLAWRVARRQMLFV
ncbi:MAG TPA: hypothetical protein VFB08_13345 [Burkholderiales bacterium]|nr:hypothetical protein [Burkholderiales bacterium]